MKRAFGKIRFGMCLLLIAALLIPCSQVQAMSVPSQAHENVASHPVIERGAADKSNPIVFYNVVAVAGMLTFWDSNH